MGDIYVPKFWKRKSLAGGTVLVLLSVLFVGTATATTPMPIDVSNDHVHCDTAYGTRKFHTSLVINGTPGIVSNEETWAVKLDGCADLDNPSVNIAEQRFRSTVTVPDWSAGTHCDTDGTPTSPVGIGASPCHALWTSGGRFDGLDHPTDDAGNFGANSCVTAVFGGLTPATATLDIRWKVKSRTPRLFDSNHAFVAESLINVSSLVNSQFGGPSPYGTQRDQVQIGGPLGQGLSNVSGSGAFTGGDGGTSGQFQAIYSNSDGAFGSWCFSTGINVLTIGLGDAIFG